MIRVFNHYLRRDTLLRVLTDLALLVCAILVVFASQSKGLLNWMPMAGTQALSLAAGMFVINTASGVYQTTSRLSVNQMWVRVLLVLVLAMPLTYLTFSLIPLGFENREPARLAATFAVAAVMLRRVYLSFSGFRSHSRSRVLVFGAGSAAQIVGTTLQASDPSVEIVGYVPGPNEKEAAVENGNIILGGRPLTEVAERAGADEIVVALTERRSGSMPLRQLLDCKLAGIKVYDLATHFEKRLGQIRIDYANAGWLVFGDGFNQGLWRTAVKRLFDIACAGFLLMLSAPIMAVTALLIKLDSRGAVFYRQERVGLNGSTFMVTKFRSMCTDAEKDGPRWASLQDSRVTRVGNVIRRLRIDELPQLINVLRGEMSLVGPRPERPCFVDQLTKEIPYFAVRCSVKPGVTGWAQVRYQYGSTIKDSLEKLQYDLYYVKNHSLFLDILILFETVGVVLTGKGAR